MGLLKCHLKGSFKQEGIWTTNPIAVGDRVLISQDSDSNGWHWIVEILPRKNYIIRRASNLSKRGHIIGANIERAYIVVTINYPVTSPTFIDRFLATCEAYDVPSGIVFNKIDRYSLQERIELSNLSKLYQSIGYDCFEVSALSGEGIKELERIITQGITLLTGHSGVGKSSLINRLVPDANLRTKEISEAHNTGVHTTTQSKMLPLRNSIEAYIIDTPGVRGFGTLDFNKDEVGHYFPEIFKQNKDCKYSNCSHTHEPGCAVLKAIEKGEIASSRYNSYLSILREDEDEKYRAPY